MFFRICTVGNRAIPYSLSHYNDTWHCNKDEDGKIFQAYCPGPNGTQCDEYFDKNEVKLIDAIPGFQLRLLKGEIQEQFSINMSNIIFLKILNGKPVTSILNHALEGLHMKGYQINSK